jgi:hypothetical protein
LALASGVQINPRTITMPNTTLPANAQAMPEADRRAVLGAVLAAGAIAATALPAAARAASSHPDAKLLALASEIEAADRENE